MLAESFARRGEESPFQSVVNGLLGGADRAVVVLPGGGFQGGCALVCSAAGGKRGLAEEPFEVEGDEAVCLSDDELVPERRVRRTLVAGEQRGKPDVSRLPRCESEAPQAPRLCALPLIAAEQRWRPRPRRARRYECANAVARLHSTRGEYARSIRPRGFGTDWPIAERSRAELTRFAR